MVAGEAESYTCLFCGGHAPRVVDAHIPLVERGDRPERLALLLRQACVFVVSNRAAR